MDEHIYNGKPRRDMPSDEISSLGTEFLLKKQFDENVLTYDSIRRVVDVKKVSLQKGSTLLLATDGIEPRSSGIPLEDLKILAQKDLARKVNNYFRKLLAYNGDTKFKSDNVALIAIR